MDQQVRSKKADFLLLALVLRTDAGGAGMRGDRSMAHLPRRKSDAARRANQVIRGRTVLIMLVLGVATFVVLFFKLYDLQVNQYESLRKSRRSAGPPGHRSGSGSTCPFYPWWASAL